MSQNRIGNNKDNYETVSSHVDFYLITKNQILRVPS